MAAFNFRSTLNFLDDLDQNNQKAWFDCHRAAYGAARTLLRLLLTA